jgi:hypothetical protein
MRKVSILAQIFLVGFAGTSLWAGPINFLTFSSATVNPLYTFTNNGDGTGSFVSNGTNNVNINFIAGSIPTADLLKPLPTGTILGTLIRTSSTSSMAVCTPSCSGNNGVTQELGTGSVMFTDSMGDNLLTIAGSDLFINGLLNGTTASFSGTSASSSIAFSSDYINFASATQVDRSISLEGIEPSLSIGPDGLLNSFTAQATGSFGVSFAPEPGTMGLGGLSVAGLITLAARSRKRCKAL